MSYTDQFYHLFRNHFLQIYYPFQSFFFLNCKSCYKFYQLCDFSFFYVKINFLPLPQKKVFTFIISQNTMFYIYFIFFHFYYQFTILLRIDQLLQNKMSTVNKSQTVQACLLHIITEVWLYDRNAVETTGFIKKNQQNIKLVREKTIVGMESKGLSFESYDDIISVFQQIFFLNTINWVDINENEKYRLLSCGIKI